MLSAATQLHCLSVEDVYRMVDAGVLRDEDRVELIDGVLVDMSPPGAEHSAAVAWLTRHFVAAVGKREVAWKAQRYARAGVEEYWIVDLPGRALTVHRRPSTDGYGQTARHGEGDRIATPVGAPAVDISALLGPPVQ